MAAADMCSNTPVGVALYYGRIFKLSYSVDDICLLFRNHEELILI